MTHMRTAIVLVLGGTIAAGCSFLSEDVDDVSLAGSAQCTKHPNDPRCVDSGGSGATGGAGGSGGGGGNCVLSGFVNGYTVADGEVCEVDGLLETDANILVLGTLVMRAGDTLRFVNVDESKFVGGGMSVMTTDVGLWVMGDGLLDFQGTPKAGWNRTGCDASWSTSDDIRVTPTAYEKWQLSEFKPYSCGSPIPRLDPTLPSAEVFNLTRDVNIEGTATGHSHVMVMSSKPQTIKHATFKHMGVSGKLGRYPLHLHFMGDASRGSLIEGVVVRDAGNHAFVAHASHGVTFKDTIAYNITDSAYWWDPIKGTGSFANATDDITYEHALAASVNANGLEQSGSMAAFALLHGTGGKVTDCVATGVQGTVNAAGFNWPPNDLQIYEFSGNVAHNNKINGIWTWHNDSSIHVIDDFVAYSNNVGIDHGAYANAHFYEDIYLFGNNIAIQLHAAARNGATWSNVTTRDSKSGTAVSVLHSGADPLGAVVFCNSDLDGAVVNTSGQPMNERLVFTSSCN
jgi:hypothetical protein